MFDFLKFNEEIYCNLKHYDEIKTCGLFCMRNMRARECLTHRLRRPPTMLLALATLQAPMSASKVVFTPRGPTAASRGHPDLNLVVASQASTSLDGAVVSERWRHRSPPRVGDPLAGTTNLHCRGKAKGVMVVLEVVEHLRPC